MNDYAAKAHSIWAMAAIPDANRSMIATTKIRHKLKWTATGIALRGPLALKKSSWKK